MEWGRNDEGIGGHRSPAGKRLNRRKEKETMRATVDLDVCIGSAMCVATAPEVFELGDDGLARAVNPDPGDDDLLQDAAEGCPVQAIILEDDEGNQVYP
jgi:ferredoxin